MTEAVQAQAPPAITAESAMHAYVKLRDTKAALKKRYEELAADLDLKMERIEGWLLNKMNEAGTDTLKNAAGTSYIQEQYRAGCSDWTTFWAWCAANNRVDLLEKRVASKAIQEYVEEHHGQLPPGINIQVTRNVIVRRA